MIKATDKIVRITLIAELSLFDFSAIDIEDEILEIFRQYGNAEMTDIEVVDKDSLEGNEINT